MWTGSNVNQPCYVPRITPDIFLYAVSVCVQKQSHQGQARVSGGGPAEVI